MLQILARETDPTKLTRLLPDVIRLLQNKVVALYQQTLPIDEFLITQRLSRDLTEYKVPSPVARAGMQLQRAGKNIQMGQKIQFVHSRKELRVHAWDLSEPCPVQHIDTSQYKELLMRAAHEILQPLGITEKLLADWVFGRSNYLAPPGVLLDGQEMPLFASLHQWRRLAG
jgi:DNA polymerase elongation subunit (family B)